MYREDFSFDIVKQPGAGFEIWEDYQFARAKKLIVDHIFRTFDLRVAMVTGGFSLSIEISLWALLPFSLPKLQSLIFSMQ